jgi:glutaminase
MLSPPATGTTPSSKSKPPPNVRTTKRALKSEYVQDLLTVMHIFGMYDFAGEWAYSVGLQAKSGVSGCILGVVPGKMGIAVFSRPLDQRGNSTRGIKAFEELSRRLGLHIFQPRQPAA